MKISHSLLCITIILTLLVFTGCSKKSDSATAIKYQLQTTNRSAVIARTVAGNLQWTSGYGSATEVKFEAKMNNNEIEYESKTAQKLDLFSAITTLGTVSLAPGTYTEAEFEVELNPTGTDAALELNGEYTSNGITTPVIFRVNTPLELKNEKSNVTVLDNNSYKALTTINLALLTKGVTEAMLNAAVSTNGSILITASINSNIYDILLNNLQDSDEVDFEHD